ncbi:hypothetical protein HPB48_018227 [Haemaphysalis longicornis]|uniref:PDZ domain-containing protein n=1 Tax=Haemaphysalis longicornis TaxID=44386 RepID=A0A9J6FFF4_HAELO|nr:hypothetical protein HPB48_018227 [Haemaphysalis longicornis]
MIDMEPDLQKPLYTYASSSFKKLVLTIKSKKAIEVDDNFMNTSGMESSEIDYRKVSVGDSMIGGGAMSAQSVKRGSPAQRSQLLQGDVVIAVNSTVISKMPLPQVKKLLNASGDQVIITVLSSSAFRILNTR